VIVNPRYATQVREHAPETAKAAFCDEVSGLRYYNPTQGRWLNRDPIRERGGANVYAMVNNDLVNQVDMVGLDPWKPNKCDCDALRVKYLPGKPLDQSLSEAQAQTAAIVSAAIETTIKNWEYDSMWYQDTTTGLFGYSDVARAPLPNGGPLSWNMQPKNSLRGLAHSHNVEYSTILLYNRENADQAEIGSRSDYEDNQASFSKSDILMVRGPYVPELIVEAPNGTYSALTKADIPSNWDGEQRLAGIPFRTGMPTPEELKRMIACKKANM